MSKDRTPSTESRVDGIAAVVLGLGALGCFALQAFSTTSETTRAETALFNALQFVLTSGFAWFSTRAVSRGGFERSLKRFAVGAYRRISDIEQIVRRLQSHIVGMRHDATGDEAHRLALVGAIAEDALQVVRSSSSDWGDVIGDELLALEDLKRLERERALIEAEPSKVQSEALAEIRQALTSRIADLQASIPPGLLLETDDQDASRATRLAADWIAKEHEREGGYRLRVYSGVGYPNESDPEAFTSETQLRTARGDDDALDLIDQEGARVGRVLNWSSPLEYLDFARGLEECFGATQIPVRFDGILEKKDDDSGLWYEVQVTASPVSRKDRELP